MKNRTLVTLLLSCITLGLKAQNVQQLSPVLSCGSTEILQLHPELLEKQEHLDAQLFAAQKTGAKGQTQSYTLPVVVHIIHQNGAENISDAQVYNAIEHLNQAYAHEGYYATKGDGAKTPVQFCLAHRDPNGNATNGITRNESSYTEMILETDDGKVKDLNRWDPLRYINIWVVKSISSISSGPGVAGYAFLPSAHGLSFDGMVCEVAYFGVSPDNDVVVIHEMGHYLGLYHTFEGGCKNDDCSQNGDRVCDTPPDFATHSACIFNSCSTDVAPGSPFTSDVDDFTGDFMDYSPFSCYYFFTQGQAERMIQSLEHIRGSLLESLGCLEPCTIPLSASFSLPSDPILAEQSVQLLSTSSGATQFKWSDDGVEFSQAENPVYAFLTMGKHTLKLKIGNADPNCIEKTSAVVNVKCAAKAGFTASLTEAVFGTEISFTNTSVANASTTYEWSVNDQPVSNNADYSQVFASPGVYAVKLSAITPVCNNDTVTYIKIKGPCADVPEPVQLQVNSAQGGFIARDMLALSDGGVLFCGQEGYKPVVIKWDEVGQVVWHRVLDLNGAIFFQMAFAPDGGFLLTGWSNPKFVICKLSANGEIVWLKTLENTGTNYHTLDFLQKMIAVNPDGSFGVIYNDVYANKHYLAKLSAEGDVIWSKRFNQIGQHISLQIATDGTGDFLLLNAATFLVNNFATTVYRVRQSDGNFLSFNYWVYPNEDILFVDNLELMTHPDGGYSIFFQVPATSSNGTAGKYLSRCTSSGTVLWTKRYQLPTPSRIDHSYIRAIPDDQGWYALDQRSGNTNPADNGVILQRLDNEGAIAWERKWSETSNYDQWKVPPVWQAGRARGTSMAPDLAHFSLVNMLDKTAPMTCFPLLPIKTEVEEVFTTGIAESPGLSTSNLTLSTKALPAQTLDYQLTSTVTCSEILPCKESCDNEIDDDGDFFADCYDDDCPCHQPDTTCIEHPETPVFAIKPAWNTEGSKVLTVDAPLVANLNPQSDSIPEILVAAWTEALGEAGILIMKGDGSDKTAPKMLKVPGKLCWRGPTHFAIADMDHDGLPEVVAQSDDYKIHIFNHFNPAADPPMQLWVSSAQASKSYNGTLSVADFDGDNIPEVVLGSQIFKLNLSNPALPTLTLALTGTAGEGASSAGVETVSSTAVDMLSLQDCFGDDDCNGLELVAGTSIYSVDLSTTDGDGYQIKEKYNLNQVDPSSRVYSDGFTAVGDINLDGKPDVMVNTSYFKNSTDYSNGVAVWSPQGFQRFYRTNNRLDFYGSGGNMLIANVFDDRKAGFAKDLPEIILLGYGKIYCMNENKASKSPNTPWWWTMIVEETSGRTSASAFDFNGDGRLEIVYRDEKQLQILYGDAAPFPKGVDEKRRWASLPISSETGDEYPVVANVDADPEAEIVTTGFYKLPDGSYNSTVSVFESDQLPWQTARPVWNQYNYFNVNINDDLSVPAVQAKHWMETAPAGSGKRPFNTNLVQGPAADTLIDLRRFTPDAQVSVDSVFCQTDSMRLQISLCNHGSEVLPVATPIAFYLKDPTLENAPLLMPPVLSNQAVEKGNCLKMTVLALAQYNSPVYIVVNDDGTRPRPYVLGPDFQAGGTAECQYGNNMTSFVFPFQPPALDLGPDQSVCQSSVLKLSAGPFFMDYRWQDGSVDSTFTAFNPGKYWVSAHDACGFVHSDTLLIALNNTFTLDLPETLSICKGESATITASGFNQYQWSPANYLDCADCPEVQVSSPQDLTVFLTARNGDCFVTDSVQINVNEPPVLILDAQNGDCDTPAFVSVQAEAGNPAYLWSSGQTGDTIFVQNAGTYTVIATDAMGCTATASASVMLGTDNDLTLNTSTSPIPCNGGPGLMAVGGLGGSGQFSYQWSNGDMGVVTEVWLPGTYTVTMTDMGSGCSKTASLEIGITGTLLVNASWADISCFGLHDGTATAVALTGLAPFTWQWAGGSTDSVQTGLSAGVYALTMNDSRGCSGSATVTISEPPALAGSVQALTNILCPGASTEIWVSASGGTPPWHYDWNTGATDSVLAQITAGTYTVTLTDARDCETQAALTLAETPDFQIVVDSVHHAGNATQANGEIFTHVQGGAGPFHVLWSNQDTTLNISMLLPGVYSLEVADAAGCSKTITVQVEYGLGTAQQPGAGWEFLVMPNPAQQGQIASLEIKAPQNATMEILLLESTGRLLWKEQADLRAGWNKRPLRSPEFGGVYFLVLKNSGVLATFRWVLE